MTTDKNRIQSYIDDELLEKLKAYAASNCLSVSQAVETLLTRCLLSDSPPANPKLLTPEDNSSASDSPTAGPQQPSPGGRLTWEDSVEEIREYAYSNLYCTSRAQRISNKEIAKRMNIRGYPLPEGVKAWTPELVSRLIQKKGSL
jgi:antitoxin component of RelBE/YafQ-DinJ toxin-antitoxin module